jgi:hypothetical protein
MAKKSLCLGHTLQPLVEEKVPIREQVVERYPDFEEPIALFC